MSPQNICIAHKSNCIKYTVLLFLFFCYSISQAQCAGTSTAITVCDIQNPSNQNINLYTLIGVAPSANGQWFDLQQSGGLNTATGILNINLIRESDVYDFIYVVNDPSCTNNTATVTVTVGGYAGVGNPNASACSDDNSVNLFQFLGNSPNPQINGIWTNAAGSIIGSNINATTYGAGTFTFKYTMPAIGTCPQSEATVALTIHRAPEPGQTSNLVLCETDDMSIHTNVNLLDYIIGQDPGGRWSESSTSELSGPFDTFINVQNIYNTLGPGKYDFVYTVQPNHPVCTRKTETVSIVIEEQIDFTGSSLEIASDICENLIPVATYIGTIRSGADPIPSGAYSVQYEVVGAFTYSGSAIGNASGGSIRFEIPNAAFPNVGNYTVTVLNIHETVGFNACQHIIGNTISDVVTVFPLPRINAGTLTVNNACQGTNLPIELSGNTNLPDGNYQVTFLLSGSNTTTSQVTTFSVAGGVGTFIILGNLIPNIGDTTIRITRISNLDSGCQNAATLSLQFYVNPKPITTNVAIAINNFCQNEAAVVNITGLGSLTGAVLNYNIIGANSISDTVTVVITGGNASFTIPATSLPNTGANVLTITGIANTVTLCGSTNLTISDSFIINALPTAPVAGDQNFCSAQIPTVADLLPNGSSYKWYNIAIGGSPLNNSTVLVPGNYWVSETSASNCPSSRTMISVSIGQIPPPTLITNGQNFCGLDIPAPILSDLSANVNFSGTLLWFDTASGGNQLSDNDILQDGKIYYGFDSDATGGCLSQTSLAVTVSLTECDDTHALLIPDGFSPNGDGVNDTFKITNIEYLFPNYTIEIFNRYGNLMYKGNRNLPNWDGTSNQSNVSINGIAPNGVYFYIVNFNKDGKSPKQGRLYLNR